jgi:type VI secretion system secreted protein VgrG
MPSEFHEDLPLAIDSPLGPQVLFVLGMEGEEGLSRLFHFQVHVVVPRQGRRASVVAPMEKLIGQPASLHLRGKHGTRHVHGIVQRFVRVENSRDKDYFHFHAELVPTLWLWTRRVRSRVFQRTSVPDILRAVFEGLRPDVEFALQGQYPQREYCVQYQESDFAFASRLMEEEGISYYFRHEADRHVLVVIDRASAFKDLPGHPELRFDDTDQPAPNTERLTSWETTRNLQAQTFTHRDQHFELSDHQPGRPLRVLQAEKAVQGDISLGAVKVPLTVPPLRPDAEPLELYEHNTGFAHRFEGPAGTNNLGTIYDQQTRVVALREEEETVGALNVDAVGKYAHVLPGFKFKVAGLEELDGPYLLTSVMHQATQAGLRSGEEPSFTYENHLTCVPEGLPVRPARKTPKPRIDGVQTAIVTGTAGKAVDVDVFGRVKVQFHWDRSDRYNQDSSCWVRTGQMWAGNRWGSFFWLRPGMEAIVTFEDGDPDRPLITGTVYNQANLPPFALPDVAAASGIVSCTLGGDPLYQTSSVVFHDEPGDEHVQIHSETHEVHSNEAWQLTRAPAGHAEFVGSIIIPAGSGSGGGLASWASTCGVQPDTSGDFTQKLLAYTPGKVSMVCGLNESITLGSRMTQMLGNSDVKVMTDYIATLASATGAISPLADLLTYYAAMIWNQGPSFAGAADVITGPKTSQVYYGAKVDITRCASYSFKGPDPFSWEDWKGQDARERLATTVVFGLNLVMNLLLPALDIAVQKQGTLKSSSTPQVADFTQKTTEASAWSGIFGPNWWANALGAVMLKIDTYMAAKESAKAKKKADDAALEAARGLLAPEHGEMTIDTRIGTIEGNLSSAKINLTKRIGDLRNAVSALTGKSLTRNGGAENFTCGNYFGLDAPNVNIIAQANTVNSPATSLTLASVGLGVNNVLKTGFLSAKATKSVDLSLVTTEAKAEAKVASVGIELKERGPFVSMQSPKGGTIFLKQSTRDPDAGGLASLWLSGLTGLVKLSTGRVIAPPLITAPGIDTHGRGAEIELEPIKGISLNAGTSTIKIHHERGIELRHGPWAIKIGPDGIWLEVAENSVHIGPAAKEEGALGEGNVVLLAKSAAKLSEQKVGVSKVDGNVINSQVV